uniref:Uncharacterized protein n=1 Tax=Tetranychus urticae TaxID=32264 RepID=T1L5Z4_TETUR
MSHEANPIEIFRQFETQRIELVCFPLKHCYRDGDLRNYQFHSEHEMVIRIVKSALLMGPYRIISFFANETNNKISRWIDTGNGSTQYMEMTAVFSGLFEDFMDCKKMTRWKCDIIYNTGGAF